VLACGVDAIYPPQNKELARDILKSGLIISEKMPCTPFEKYHFPQRNRVISGLSRAICVIEGKRQSGALVTARFALDQNKDIYALPGDVGRPEADGPNFLISNGAKILLKPDDIALDICEEFAPTKPEKKATLTETEKFIVSIIEKYPTAVHMDQLIIETGYTIGLMSETLLLLEVKNVIKVTDKGKYAMN
jgi:DNA processing protein